MASLFISCASYNGEFNFSIAADSRIEIHPEKLNELIECEIDEILSKIHSKIIANNLVVQKLNKKGSIIQVVVTTNDEYFSKIFNERIIEAAKYFYLNINNLLVNLN